ncbi:hypothetical protein [Mesorhizobium sp.]|uniref:hypothetical protein n=1 Tax=Mesorhizobium sp. TaxID=1871066 RepID=UPI0025CE2331|nr:hypothetical protein [Mesorhizobium sp.]
MIRKAPLGQFLSRNPFPNGLTDGLFYREKMRAIHRVAPAAIEGPILEIGGGHTTSHFVILESAVARFSTRWRRPLRRLAMRCTGPRHGVRKRRFAGANDFVAQMTPWRE